MSAQLPLALPVGPDQRFDLFVGHDWAVDTLQSAVRRSSLAQAFFVEGAEGSGKTHLLLAACRAAEAEGQRARYLPLPAFAGALSMALEGMEANDVLALDGLEAVAASRSDTEALFHLHNRAMDAGRVLIYASTLPPSAEDWALPDLRSRLGQSVRLTLEGLDDAGRREALRRRAARRGLELDDAVLDWLFRRVDRDLRSMTSLLDTLDRAAMAAQRRLTVPFVRQVLEQS